MWTAPTEPAPSKFKEPEFPFKLDTVSCEIDYPSVILDDGSIYTGQLVESRREGFGKQNWLDESLYEGEFLNNERSGQGTYRSANGSVYTGSFLNDEMHGE